MSDVEALAVAVLDAHGGTVHGSTLVDVVAGFLWHPTIGATLNLDWADWVEMAEAELNRIAHQTDLLNVTKDD